MLYSAPSVDVLPSLTVAMEVWPDWSKRRRRKRRRRSKEMERT